MVSGLHALIPIETKELAVFEAVNLIVSVVQVVSQNASGADLQEVKLKEAIKTVKHTREKIILIILVLYQTKITNAIIRG